MTFDGLAWIHENLNPAPTTAAEFLYERMESQSGRSLPIIYQPFDADRLDHWVDRGQILDFWATLGGGRILDIGPGDGWPSLPLAPLVGEVVGVDPSSLRVRVCCENAARLGVENATFVQGAEDGTLPFEDVSFDGVAAASSIEQCPHPRRLLREIVRVLRPGGRLRLHYEALDRYRGGRERELDLLDAPDGTAYLLLFDRHIAEECVDQIALALDLTRKATLDAFGSQEPAYGDLTAVRLQALAPHVIAAGAWQTRHPYCETWLRWLGEVGFASTIATENGGDVGAALYDATLTKPTTLAGADALLREPVRNAMARPTPCSKGDPWITAVKAG